MANKERTIQLRLRGVPSPYVLSVAEELKKRKQEVRNEPLAPDEKPHIVIAFSSYHMFKEYVPECIDNLVSQAIPWLEGKEFSPNENSQVYRG